MAAGRPQTPPSGGEGNGARLELVLKCDVSGTEEAVRESLAALSVPGVEISVIQSGVGKITKSDVLMAQTGSRLVVGFNVEPVAKLEELVRAHGVEVRLYDTIYRLTEDVRRIADSLPAQGPQETVLGQAKVIAVFHRKRGSQVIGCEVTEGRIEAGRLLRVIKAMGPAYHGQVGSLQVEGRPVKTGRAGQQVGIQLPDWDRAEVGDLVECYQTAPPARAPWRPRPGIHRRMS